MKTLSRTTNLITSKKVKELIESLAINERTLQEFLSFYESGLDKIAKSLIDISKSFQSVKSIDGLSSLSGSIKELDKIFIEVESLNRDYEDFKVLLKQFSNSSGVSEVIEENKPTFPVIEFLNLRKLIFPDEVKSSFLSCSSKLANFVKSKLIVDLVGILRKMKDTLSHSKKTGSVFFLTSDVKAVEQKMEQVFSNLQEIEYDVFKLK